MSKGSKQRPCNKEKFNANYDRIFNKPKKKDKLVITNVSRETSDRS